jgi:hypothetical protein
MLIYLVDFDVVRTVYNAHFNVTISYHLYQVDLLRVNFRLMSLALYAIA